MRLLAALSVAVFCASLVGALAGVLPGRHRFRAVTRRRPAPLRTWLAQAGLPLTPAQFVLGSTLAGGAALLVVTALTGSVFVAVVPAVAIGFVPRAFFARRRRERLRQVQAAWPDGLRDLVASIASGRSLTQAVAALATTGPPALRAAFARFPELGRVLGTGPALDVVKEELSDPTSDRVLEVLALAHERGGAIVRTILEELTDATTKDLKLLETIETEGLEMRINARAVVVLPWLVLVALTSQQGPFRDFYRSGAGLATLAVAAAMSAVGVVVLDRLGRQPIEERVFPSSRGVT